MTTLTVQRIIGERPAHINADWIIFNAPRPLWGTTTWEDDFRHGVFYAAINPRDSYAERGIRDNISLDGWLCEYVTEADIMTWAKEFAKREGIDLSYFDAADARRSYFEHEGRVHVECAPNTALQATRLRVASASA